VLGANNLYADVIKELYINRLLIFDLHINHSVMRSNVGASAFLSIGAILFKQLLVLLEADVSINYMHGELKKKINSTSFH
jgi:hypothetical protein